MRRFFLLLAILSIATILQAQSTRYFWYHSLTVSTTAVDSTFTIPWETCIIYADTVDIYIRVGAPDVTNWSTRPWLLIENGMTLSIGPYPKLKRLEYKTSTGTGTLYLLGYKKEGQY